MLKLDGISKVYKVGTFGGKEIQAVCNASFEVGDKEVVSLIGESGSGKSTIGKLILRLTAASSGRILFNDGDISILKHAALKEYYRNVQGVFQDPFCSYNPIFKADRVFRLIKEQFFAEVSAEQWKDKIDTALEAVGLNPEHVLDKYPHQLSGGQLQRFLIARALLLDIQFLVADEIISMLDASTRIDVLNLLADLKSRGLSILFITHDLSLAHYISERAVILYRGCIVEMGETDKIFNNSLHPYTQMLIACVPSLDRKWEAKTVADAQRKSGQPANTSGCAYFERCPGANQRCLDEKPTLKEVEPGHFVACIGLVD